MKGTLHKTENGWEVIHFQATLNEPLFQSLPLHPDETDMDVLELIPEGKEVEFEIINFPVPPTNGPVNNSISQYARLIDKSTRPLTEDDVWPKYPTRADQLREQVWEEIIREFYRDAQQVPKGAPPLIFECWLVENYNPPIKKQDNE